MLISCLVKNVLPVETKEGWAWIEDLMDKNDRVWVNGYMDDINALLVFVSSGTI